MTPFAIRADGLSKEYMIGEQYGAGGTLYDLLSGLFRRNGADTGQARARKRFEALRGVSFALRPGEVAGVIGRNGAGKSTLLKLLSRITAPTQGRIEVRGRLASLLEIGTGFHPELSGRENIYLNGAILGMTRAEVSRKFDEIVAFAEVDKFIDTPVKHYSSGMYVRLAFAVAAHLETDVLLVDEVLAVGDAAFQRKSLGKMSDVAKGGRTVLFVSHNLGAVRNLCSRSLLLDGGTLKFDGATSDALAIYESGLSDLGGKLAPAHFNGPLADRVVLDEVKFLQAGGSVTILDPMQKFWIELHGQARRGFAELDLNIALYRDGFHITSLFDTPRASSLREGSFTSRFEVPGGVLRTGRYTIGIGVSTSSEWLWGSDVATLEFSENLGDRPVHRVAGSVELPYSAERHQ
jgi:lipopolysaccharide transport system ATP-binding protein